MEKSNKATILIIDDIPANIFALENLLISDDRVILSATNGNEALRVSLNEEIDLIIMDVKMPEMDGFEVAQILQSNRKTRDIPLIFATAERKEHSFMMQGYKEGAIDYIFKPLSPEIVKAKVAVLLKFQMQKKELLEKNTSLKKSELLINNSADIIGIIDVETLIIEEINNAFTDILGYSKDEAIGTSLTAFLEPADRRFVLQQSKNAKLRLSFETLTYCKNRDTKWVEWNVVLRDGKWFVNARDITTEKKANEALLNQKNLYETLLMTESEMGQGVLITEMEKIIYVNDAVCKIYGYSRDEILQFPSFLNVIPEREKPRLMRQFKKHIKDKKQQGSGEIRVVRKDGTIIDIEYRLCNMEVNGRIQTLSIIRDITEKKQKEEQLHTERERAESAEIAKRIGERFLATMSHEIRTPMNAIIGFTNVLLQTPLTSEQNQYLEAIRTSGNNLLVIINDILDFSRIKSGKIPIEQRAFKLSSVISACTELMQSKASEKGISLSAHIDSNIHDDLMGDATRLNQILLNLTANAIKFTTKGKVKIDVKLLSDSTDEVEIQLAVKDTGIGISKDKLFTIFEAFTQADDDTARIYGGTGLGLAIVKQLAELQNGRVAVSSEEGKGSCFYFTINYKKNLQPIPKLSTCIDTEEKEIEKLNILLVEDNTINQLLAQKVLSDWGWNVDIVENGIGAIEKIKSTDFDVILMDIQMPEMDGYETTEHIRRLPVPKGNIPILAMTAHVMPNEEQRCYSIGMNGYISKPFNTEILYSKILSIAKKEATTPN